MRYRFPLSSPLSRISGYLYAASSTCSTGRLTIRWLVVREACDDKTKIALQPSGKLHTNHTAHEAPYLNPEQVDTRCMDLPGQRGSKTLDRVVKVQVLVDWSIS